MTAAVCSHCGQPMIGVAGFVFDWKGRVFWTNGRATRLTQMEADILSVLIERFGRDVPTDYLLDRLDGGTGEQAREGVIIRICQLRRKFLNANAPVEIPKGLWGAYSIRTKED